MLSLKKLFYSPAREIRRLNTDAPNIVQYALQCFTPAMVRGIANATREQLARVHSVYPGNQDGWELAVKDYQRLHRDARRSRDDVALTAYTFVLIYIRAEVHGEACRLARDTIDGFIAEHGDAAEE